jgi:uncharacterized OsmC-like protein
MTDDSDWPVIVRRAPDGKLAQDVTVGGHTVRADEPTPLGDGTGPTPHQLLLAALGSCTAMTLRLYAERKKWDLGALSVRLRIRWEPIEGGGERRAIIERVIESDRALTAEQQARLIEIADKCPVHRTLMGEKTISTRMAAVVAEI